MGAFNLKSKTVMAALGAILIIAGDFLKVGIFDIASIVDLIQAALAPLMVIFLRHGISKTEKN